MRKAPGQTKHRAVDWDRFVYRYVFYKERHVKSTTTHKFIYCLSADVFFTSKFYDKENDL